jgi:hypothetical protein
LVLLSTLPRLNAAYQNSDYSFRVLTNNALGYWQLSESTGSVMTDFANTPGAPQHGSQDGTYIKGGSAYGGTLKTQAGATTMGFGPGHTAVTFNDGSATSPDYAQAQLPTSLADSPYTIEWWFNDARPFGDSPVTGYMVTRSQTYNARGDNVGIAGFAFGGDSGHLFVYNDVDTTLIGPTLLTTGTWYYAALVRSSSSSVSLYLNGQLEASSSSFNLRYTTGTNLWVGLRPDGNFGFLGGLSDVAIYDRALSGAEILANYNQSLIPEPSAVALLGLGGVIVLWRRKA